MKRIDKYRSIEKFTGDEGETLELTYTNNISDHNYHEGVRLHFYEQEWANEISVLLEDREAKRMRDFLLKLYPLTDKQSTG